MRGKKKLQPPRVPDCSPQRTPAKLCEWIKLSWEVNELRKEPQHLGSEGSSSPMSTPLVSPQKRTSKITPQEDPSDFKGKGKATNEDGSEDKAEAIEEADKEEEINEGEEEEEVVRKPTCGRPRKAILKDAAKRLKKL
ncbi:hypothetical protein PTTG_03227 [Puccinia triticina 1-1 BBBD Race 1]|uniref:Uncharacterized protein n=1 Tax=Puccinia triticina (isolate 1-1 / race 1 (BBBD)) TaxID=630390 RepID=A0A180GVE9_PUCT1|nr:hypothetical protein PTTG_03227 [Puccinia triticina 1-1 BBBD Race 1]